MKAIATVLICLTAVCAQTAEEFETLEALDADRKQLKLDDIE
jgi:hypothetical protein